MHARVWSTRGDDDIGTTRSDLDRYPESEDSVQSRLARILIKSQKRRNGRNPLLRAQLTRALVQGCLKWMLSLIRIRSTMILTLLSWIGTLSLAVFGTLSLGNGC